MKPTDRHPWAFLCRVADYRTTRADCRGSSAVQNPQLVADAANKVGSQCVVVAIDSKQVEFFEKKVQPIFKATCFKCHSLEENKAKGGLTLDTREGLLKGGENGAVAVDNRRRRVTRESNCGTI